MLFGFDFRGLSTGFEQFVNFTAIFLKLCPSAISRNSNSTFSNPLNVNLLNLWFYPQLCGFCIFDKKR